MVTLHQTELFCVLCNVFRTYFSQFKNFPRRTHVSASRTFISVLISTKYGFFQCEFISEYFPGCVNRIFNYYFLCFFYLERKNRVGGCVNGPPSCFFCFVLHVGSYTFELLLINSALTSNYIQQILYTFRNYRMIYDTALQYLNLVMFLESMKCNIL